MSTRLLLIAGTLLWTANPLAAQSAAPPPDPITGNWTGYVGPGTVPQLQVTMDLKFDGKSAVTGTAGPTIPHNGTVKAGTYDPATGALAFDVELADGASVTRIHFDGTLVRGTVTGRLSGDGQTGTFKLTKGPAESPPVQPAASSDAAAELRRSFGEVAGSVTKAADLVPADKYSYKPVASVRTYGQLIAHITDSYNYYCARAAGRAVQWSDPIEKGATDKATVGAKLKQALDACHTVYGGATGQAGPLIDNLGHTNLHYGNIITYLRMLGLVPPSS